MVGEVILVWRKSRGSKGRGGRDGRREEGRVRYLDERRGSDVST